MRKGFTLLELLIVVVILGVLALIATPSMLNAAERSKQAAVKANVAAAVSSITSQYAVNSTIEVDQIAASVTTELLKSGQNPYDSDTPAFAVGSSGAIGQVTLDDGTSGQITVTGYGKDASTVLVQKVVEAPTEDE
jgi:type IV pilus assembly protein PilA